MVDSIKRVLTIIVVGVLILLFLPLLGPFVSNAAPPAGAALGDMLAAAWAALENIMQSLSTNHPYK